jgi:hypothetical protein
MAEAERLGHEAQLRKQTEERQAATAREREAALASEMRRVIGVWQIVAPYLGEKQEFKGAIIITNSPSGMLIVRAAFDFGYKVGWWRRYRATIDSHDWPSLSIFNRSGTLWHRGPGYHGASAQFYPDEEFEMPEFVVPASVRVTRQDSDGKHTYEYRTVHFGTPLGFDGENSYSTDGSILHMNDFCLYMRDAQNYELPLKLWRVTGTEASRQTEAVIKELDRASSAALEKLKKARQRE